MAPNVPFSELFRSKMHQNILQFQVQEVVPEQYCPTRFQLHSSSDPHFVANTSEPGDSVSEQSLPPILGPGSNNTDSQEEEFG
ncbi:unnamed protein product [Protopolystoma xenopodis]|uniref:Uncharacterized protein n=1 Tax=Protopolystoma xenopodis TaxID=117903 RepID=A0A448XDN6_9PLAT|nr:unnamed protein product [Protopolystoma xenopodis]